uniref:UDP-glycose: glycosyltransferase UGT89D6 n=1 Tax=Fagopyrum esculentum TaxID=3617 RepID=A0A0A1HAP0_FAGES|nr:UDP-glycose: glycosyltransferase UGT89D6 [Fagopyrum esculentum]
MSTATHILVFPHPAQGHMLPLLDLTNQLAIRGLRITILVTPKNLPILTPILTAHPSIQTLVLSLPPHPKLPVGAENIRDIGNRGNFPLVSALSKLAGPISDWFNSHPSPPHAIISDFFLGWTHSLATQLGIPRIAFFSSGAFLCSIFSILFSDIARFKALHSVEFTDLPNSPAFKEEHLPSVFRFYNESDPDSRSFKEGLLANMSSWGCVFNSFRALEGQYLDHFRKLTVHRRVHGVGPLSLFRINSDQESSCEPVLTWLDDCPDGSVLYVSFGSQKWLSEPQLQALGLALEKSQTRFIWVVRGEPELDGLEERVAGRGLVVREWAPQVEILGHRAVGGFLSHCGWNSALESVVAGVMIVAWPMEADQYVNARILVEELGVGVHACEGPQTVPDPDELGRVIKDAMGLNAAQKLRAKELKEKAFEAVRDGGSSVTELDEFVNELVRVCPK